MAFSLVVPTYNERERLADFVEAVFVACREAGLGVELVIVDDNSPDGTGRLADDLAERYPIRVVHRAGKLGLGTAVMEGFRNATGDVLAVMDADLSHPPAALVQLLAVLAATDCDFVIGSRYIPGGQIRNWSRLRLGLSRLACLMARPLTRVQDATSGFFVVRRRVIKGVQIAAGGFKICLELLYRGHAASVAEVPYQFVDRAAGESKMSLREALGYLKQLAQLWSWRRRAPGWKAPAYRRITAAEAERYSRALTSTP